MRVLVAHNVTRARTGGMSRIMGFIHDRIAADGAEVVEFTAEDAPPYARGRLARFGFPWAVYRHALAAHRRGQGYDVINVHEPAGAVVAAMKRQLGRPAVVVTSHGVERRAWELALEERRLGREGPSRKTRVVYPLTSLPQSGYALRHADHLFCLNFEDRDYLVRRYGRREGDITRIYPAADELFGRAAAGRDYSRGDRLLFAATWRKNKGVEDLIPAFAELARRDGQLSLTVLGAGVPADAVRAAFPADVRGRVHPVTCTSEEATAAAFAACDIFLLPSLFEGTPLTLMEALASGLPVVSTATCGMKDVIRDGQNGLLVPIRAAGDITRAVAKLTADRSLREALGRSAQETAAEFTWDRVSVPVADVYRRLKERSTRAGSPTGKPA